GTVTEVLTDGDDQHRATVRAGRITLTAFAPAGVGAGDQVLAFVRPENIEVLADGTTRDDPGIVEGTVEQIVFEGPSIRLTVDADGIPLKVVVGGVERLTLLDANQRRLRLRLREVSLVRATSPE